MNLKEDERLCQSQGESLYPSYAVRHLTLLMYAAEEERKKERKDRRNKKNYLHLISLCVLSFNWLNR